MGLDRGQALGGINIGAQARVRSQVAGKVIGKGLAELECRCWLRKILEFSDANIVNGLGR
jgi:hypothetical protein